MMGLFKNKSITAPVSGELIMLSKVKDEVFSTKMLGDGCAIIPNDNKIYSPIDGEVNFVFPTNHAVGLVTNDGVEIIIHIGIDTVNLNGLGFKRFIEANQKVKAGQLLIEFDESYLENQAVDLTTPIIIVNMNKLNKFEVVQPKSISNKEMIIQYSIK